MGNCEFDAQLFPHGETKQSRAIPRAVWLISWTQYPGGVLRPKSLPTGVCLVAQYSRASLEPPRFAFPYPRHMRSIARCSSARLGSRLVVECVPVIPHDCREQFHCGEIGEIGVFL